MRLKLTLTEICAPLGCARGISAHAGPAEYNLLHRTPTFGSDTFFTVTLPSLIYGLTKEQLVASVLPPTETPVMTPVTTPVVRLVDRLMNARQRKILTALKQGEMASSDIVAAVDGISANNLRRRLYALFA